MAPDSQPAGGADDATCRRATLRGWLAAGLLIGALAIAALIAVPFSFPGGDSRAAAAVPAQYDADRAFGYLEKICDIGPRVSGTPGMERQRAMLVDFFRGRGGEIEEQAFQVRHPLTGEAVTMVNLIARFESSRPKRFLICAHYDTRPFPDRDPVDPRGVFLGANDGGSGTAALMELAHHLDELPEDVGIDLVLFDGEELVYDNDRDPYFLGSTHFARQYAEKPPSSPYRAGVLLDMVGDAELQLYLEINSWRYARDVAREIWDTADRLGVDAFHRRTRHEVRDDHLPLNQIAKIPTVDIIDFDYPRPGFRTQSYWHTRQDTPENCSGESIVSVVYVVHQWLMQQ